MKDELKKHYPKDWVVLQNRVAECFRGMSLDEKRLFILATPLARTTKISSNEPVFISSSEFSRECGIDLSTAYTALETATDRLFTRFFSYTTYEGNRVKIRWVNKVIYLAGQGGTELYFTDEVLLLLREFDALNPYTKYKKEVVLRLKKDYSLDLYHLAKKHQILGSFQITLDDLFEQLGLPDSYRRIGNLKDRVIKPSLDEISSNTDIELTYENLKKGRSVVGLKFFVKEKPKPKIVENGNRDRNTVDMFCNLTDAQINKYSMILSQLPDLSDLSNFPTYDAFAIWLSNILRDPKSVSEGTAKRIFSALYKKTDFKQFVTFEAK
jgi:plasmid replication initiation protein